MQVQVGSAELCITPPIPILMGGYSARVGPAEGMHDNLFVRCLFFQSSDTDSAVGTRHALFSYDLVGVPEAFVTRVKSRLEEACGIPADQVVLHATHTHSGPDLGGLHDQDTVDKKQILYTDYLVELSLTACFAAMRNLESVQMSTGQRELSGVGSVRRLGQGVVLPIQVTGWYRDSDESLKAVVVSFPCHPTIMGASNRLLSADYPGSVVQTVKRLCGHGVTVLPLTGAAGDISTRFTRRSQTFAEVDRLGTMVGAAAVQTLLEASRTEFASLFSVQATFALDVQPIPDVGVLAELKQLAEQAVNVRQDLATKRIAETQLQGIEAIQAIQAALSHQRKALPHVLATVSVWSFGSSVYAFWPGEPFHGYDARFKQVTGVVEDGQSAAVDGPDGTATIVGYSDGMIGYIPDISLAEDTSYEVLMSLVGDAGGHSLMEHTTHLFHRLSQTERRCLDDQR